LVSPTTAIGRGLEPLNARTDLRTSWWWKQKKYISGTQNYY
jgi:hypothetical protein